MGCMLRFQQRQGEHPLQVARCSKIIKAGSTKTGPGGTESAEDAAPSALNPQDGAGAGNPEGDKYVINVKQHAKFVVGLSDKVSPTDIEEGMRVG
jgi:26S proteasome regulatory subunit T1